MKIKSIAASLCALLLICTVLVGCGSNDMSNEFQQGGVNDGSSQSLAEPMGKGFTLNHAVEAGFGMGSDTPDTIFSRFGQPNSTETNEYTAVTITTASYSFGDFEFRAGKGETPVLTYAGIKSDYAGPCGINIGSSLTDVAEKIYTGSAAMLGDLSAQSVSFYGDGVNPPSGYYTWLTVEFTSSSTSEKYALRYIADTYEDGATVKYTLYFDTDYKLVWYELQYITA